MKFIKCMLWVCVILTASVIFSFSSQPATESDSVSKGVTRSIIDILPMTKNLPEAQKAEIVNTINHFVRKTAHFALYFTFGLFLITAMLVTYENKLSLLKIVIISMIITILYAISDEVHQAFVPNRGPGVKDVFIDFSGSLCAFSVVLIARYVILKVKSKRNLKFE